MNLIIKIFILNLFIFVVSCGNYKNQLQVDWIENLKRLYVEDDGFAGFINQDSKQVDAMSTYNGLIVNDFTGDKVNINKTKIKNYTLKRVQEVIVENKLTRDLTEERYILELIDYLGISLDDQIKNKIIKNLDDHIQEEDKKIPSSNVKINKQFKTQIHYNYLYIIEKLNHNDIDQRIKSIIIRNLMDVEENLDSEGSSPRCCVKIPL